MFSLFCEVRHHQQVITVVQLLCTDSVSANQNSTPYLRSPEAGPPSTKVSFVHKIARVMSSSLCYEVCARNAGPA